MSTPMRDFWVLDESGCTQVIRAQWVVCHKGQLIFKHREMVDGVVNDTPGTPLEVVAVYAACKWIRYTTIPSANRPAGAVVKPITGGGTCSYD